MGELFRNSLWTLRHLYYGLYSLAVYKNIYYITKH